MSPAAYGVAGSADAVDRERLRSDASVEPSAGTVAAAGRAPRDSRQDSYDAKTGRPTTAPRPSMIVDQHRHVQETREAWRQRGSRDFLELRGKQIRCALPVRTRRRGDLREAQRAKWLIDMRAACAVCALNSPIPLRIPP
jgi:hypothetical protein